MEHKEESGREQVIIPDKTKSGREIIGDQRRTSIGEPAATVGGNPNSFAMSGTNIEEPLSLKPVPLNTIGGGKVRVISEVGVEVGSNEK